MPAQPELVANDVLAPASLVELAERRLRSEILSGALVPGERLIEEQLSPQDVDELFSLREMLERFAVQTAPPVPDPLALAELANRLDAMQQAEAHRQFHIALVAMAGHRHLLLVYEPVILKLQLYMAANLRREAQVGTPQDGVRRHQRLFDAVAAGDVAAVLAALGDHGARSFFA